MQRNSPVALLAVVLALLLGYSWAPRGGAARAEPKFDGSTIALVDMLKLFNAHKGYTGRRDELQKEITEAQQTFNAKAASIRKLEEEGKSARQGSEEHKRLAEEWRTKMKDLETFRREKLQRLAEEEKQLNIKTFQEIVEQIEKYSEAHGLRLVVRYSSDPLDDSKNPQEVLGLVNQFVVYQRGLDITEEIIASLN